MNYNVVPLNGGSQFDLNGVRFNGKSFMFWKKKGISKIQGVVVVFDKKYENVPIRDGVIILTLKGLSNYNDVKEAIQVFFNIMKSSDIRIHFIIGNESEKMLVETLGRDLALSYTIQDMNKEDKKNIQQETKIMEEGLKNQSSTNMNVSSSQVVEKYDNGTLKQYTVDQGVAYENKGLLSLEEEKMILFREWMRDPVKKEELSKLSVEARNDLLTKAVMRKSKGYRLESASEQLGNDKVGEVARDKAINENGKVNTELGIVQNELPSSNKYSVVEKHGEDVKVVNANVINSQISMNGMSGVNKTYTTDRDYAYVSNNVSNNQQQIQSRNVDVLLYVDEEYNLYNHEGNILGKIGMNGYSINSYDNTVIKDGQVVGSLGDYKELGRSSQDDYSKPKVRTFKKPEREIVQDKRAAFISFPVIIFIFSAMLLIVSAVLLFLVD